MNKIQVAFKQAMRIMASDLGLKLKDLNLSIRFDEKGIPDLVARKESKNLKRVRIGQLIKPKMIGARICAKKLTHFFRIIHVAYLKGAKINNPKVVSLVFYPSKKVEEICVGIYVNGTAKKAFRLSEVIELTGLDRELHILN